MDLLFIGTESLFFGNLHKLLAILRKTHRILPKMQALETRKYDPDQLSFEQTRTLFQNLYSIYPLLHIPISLFPSSHQTLSLALLINSALFLR